MEPKIERINQYLNKKGFSFTYAWVEINAIILAVAGFFIALSLTGRPNLNYIVVSISGFLIGRFMYQGRKRGTASIIIISAGFYLGYVLGSFYVSRSLVVFLLILSTTVSYYVHSKHYV